MVDLYQDGRHDDDLLPWDVIAALLGVSRQTVRRQYEDALVKLRAEFEKNGLTEEEFMYYLKHRSTNVRSDEE